MLISQETIIKPYLNKFTLFPGFFLYLKIFFAYKNTKLWKIAKILRANLLFEWYFKRNIVKDIYIICNIIII